MRRKSARSTVATSPNWMLVCAMLALSVHVFNSMGLMPARVNGLNHAERFFAEVCTGTGLRSAAADPRGSSQPANPEPDCCEPCTLSGGPALTHSQPYTGSSSPGTGHPGVAILAPPFRRDWALQAPRGPPAQG